MTHKFDEVVSAVCEAIKAGAPTDTNISVYNTRVTGIPQDKLPAINVYYGQDSNDKSPDEGNNFRKMQFFIQISVSGDDEPDKVLEAPAQSPIVVELNQIREWVENIFRAHWYNLGGLVHRVNLVGGQINYGDRAQAIPASCRIEYEAQYREPLRRGTK